MGATREDPSTASAGATPGRRRSVTVADYTVQPAAEAAAAVRAAGLRPAPERAETDDPAQDGLVVAQDPPPGETVATGALVTLHVAALPAPLTPAEPEPSPAASEPEPEPTAEPEPVGSSPSPPPAPEPQPPDLTAPEASTRRRGRGGRAIAAMGGLAALIWAGAALGAHNHKAPPREQPAEPHRSRPPRRPGLVHEVRLRPRPRPPRPVRAPHRSHVARHDRVVPALPRPAPHAPPAPTWNRPRDPQGSEFF